MATKRKQTTKKGPGAPPLREVREQLQRARHRLAKGDSLEAIVADLGLLVAIGLLHPHTPDDVERLLRGDEPPRPPRPAHAPAPDDHELLGVLPGATRDEIDAAHRRAILACHPDRFAALSPAIQQTMTELATRINGARARLLGE